MPKQPLAEVFGFPTNNFSEEAQRTRRLRLCPYHNRVPSCTKDKAQNPLGVCSILDGEKMIITCPIRFRQDWLIAEHAADFFFDKGTSWTSLSEIRLDDKNGLSAGNIDLVLVSYDNNGKLIDFGSVEVQAVYISGNVRRPFEAYMSDPNANHDFDWRGQTNYPRPDFLSSSRKRLAPQLLFKGGILNAWRKKQAVVVDKPFFDTLPTMSRVNKDEAELVWLVYESRLDVDKMQYKISLQESVYTRFTPTLLKITVPEIGDLGDFEQKLQMRLDEKLDSNPPEAPTLNELGNL